jgi:hypothetical protein
VFWTSENILKGIKVKVPEQKFVLASGSFTCVFADIVCNEKKNTLRAVNIKGLGRNFNELRDHFLSYYQQKLDRNRLFQRIICFTIGSVIAAYFLSKLNQIIQFL